jgi:hypothetical protein
VKNDFRLIALDMLYPKYQKILRDCFHDEALQAEQAMAEADMRYWCICLLPGDSPPYLCTLAGHRTIEDLTAEVEWHLSACGQPIAISPRLNQRDRDHLYAAVDALLDMTLAECAPVGGVQ